MVLFFYPTDPLCLLTWLKRELRHISIIGTPVPRILAVSQTHVARISTPCKSSNRRAARTFSVDVIVAVSLIEAEDLALLQS